MVKTLDYASTCLNDLADCYNQQITQLNSWSSSANQTDVYNVVRGACRNIGLTCAYAVFANDTTSCPRQVTGSNTQAANELKCLKSISIMFDPTIACPENSTYVGNGAGEVGNNQCVCNNTYVAVNGNCVKCGYFGINSTNNIETSGFACESTSNWTPEQYTSLLNSGRAGRLNRVINTSRYTAPGVTDRVTDLYSRIEARDRVPAYICSSIYEHLDPNAEGNTNHYSGQCTCPTGYGWIRTTNTCNTN